eukprot:208165_1
MSDIQTNLEKSNWVTGIILNLLGSFSINFGTNLIQYSHYLTTKYKQASISSLKPSSIFCIGWFIFVSGNLLNFLSFSYATQTILSSLGSVQFIANILFIYILFKISPTKHQLFGTINIIAGNISIVVVANKSTFKFDTTQLIHLFLRIEYVSYLIIIILLSIFSQSLYYYVNRQQPTKPTLNYLMPHPDQPEMPTKRAPSLLSNSLELHTHKLHHFLLSKSELLLPVLYALVSAMIGTQSVVLAKSSSFLITKSISQFGDPVTYCFIAAWCVAMMFWLYRMNSALRKYEGVFIIPVLQVLWMLFSILSGGILFKEFDGYYWYNYMVFILATAVIFYGVYQLSQAKATQTNPQKDIELCASPPRDIEEEELIDLNIVRQNMNALCDDPSLTNSSTDLAIADTADKRFPENDMMSNSVSLRTIHKFFETSGKIIMKVTGSDGRTHLAGPSLSSSIQTFQPYIVHNVPSAPENTQSLPTKLPSELSNALDKIKVEMNCVTEEEIPKASSCD